MNNEIPEAAINENENSHFILNEVLVGFEKGCGTMVFSSQDPDKARDWKNLKAGRTIMRLERWERFTEANDV